MRKDELRSLVANLLPKYEEIEAHHSRVIDAAIEKGLAEFYNLIFLRDSLELQRYVREFGYTTAIPVALEATTGLYYSNYPTGYSIIPIPDSASGVRRISTPLQGSATFFPIDARGMDIWRGSHNVNTVTDKIGYCPRRTRVEYYNINVAVIASGVRMDLLIPFSQYADSDVVLVPELVNDQGLGLVDRVLQILSNVKPTELNENKQLEEAK